MSKKINILQFICPTGIYGAEMWIIALAKRLDAGKLTCQLAVTKDSPNQNLEICERIRTLGFPTHIIPMQGKFDPWAIKELVKLIKAQNIDIIHTHGYKSDLIGLIAAKIAGIKIIATPHGFENSNDKKLQFYIKLGLVALKFCNSIAPLSNDIQQELLNNYISPDRIRLIYNGVDLEEIEAITKPDQKDESDDKLIGYVGQISLRKNVIDIIKAFDLLYRSHQNIRLKLVGDGPQREHLERFIIGLDSKQKIEFTGYRKDRLDILKTFDLFTMTSTLEGIPRAMMEAMALGVPVAAFDIPGVDTLITHEATGMLAPYGNVSVLRDHWKKILFDEQFSKQLAVRAKKKIYQKFSNQRMAEEYLTLYKAVLNR